MILVEIGYLWRVKSIAIYSIALHELTTVELPGFLILKNNDSIKMVWCYESQWVPAHTRSVICHIMEVRS